MITGSILLALVAVVSLSVGLIRGQEDFYYCSIVASLLAGSALLVGLRQRPGAQLRAMGRATVPRPARTGPAGTTYESGSLRQVDAGTGVGADAGTDVDVFEDPQVTP